MNEQELGFRIKQALNHNGDVPAGALARLEAARASALLHQRQPAPASVLNWAGSVAGVSGGPRHVVSRVVLPALVLALGLFVVNYWHQAQLAQENAEIDAEVLTGDLPLDAYLDKGFDAWLRRSSE
jgi:hypothetical protein